MKIPAVSKSFDCLIDNVHPLMSISIVETVGLFPASLINLKVSNAETRSLFYFLLLFSFLPSFLSFVNKIKKLLDLHVDE